MKSQIPMLDTTILDRMERAVEKIRERLARIGDVLERGGIPFAITEDIVVADLGRDDRRNGSAQYARCGFVARTSRLRTCQRGAGKYWV